MNMYKKNRRGAAAVEFAIVVPMLIVFFFGLIEWGRFEMVRQISSTAAFKAARIGSLPGATVEGTEEAAQGILKSYFVNDASVTATLNADETIVNVSIPMKQNSFGLVTLFGDSTIEREFALQIF